MNATETKTTLRPTGDRILIRPDAAEEKSRGGIFIPATGQVRPAQGTILAVGPGRDIDYVELVSEVARVTENFTKMVPNGYFYLPGEIVPRVIPVAFKAGMRVLYTRYSGTEVKHNEEELVFVSEGNVLAVIENAPDVG